MMAMEEMICKYLHVHFDNVLLFKYKWRCVI